MEGRRDLPTRSTHAAGAFETSSTLVEVAPCRRFGAIFTCGVAAAGALRLTRAEPDVPRSTLEPYAAFGARLGVDLQIVEPLRFRLRGELLSPFVRTRAVIGSTTVWRSPLLAGHVGTAAVVRFF